MSTDMAVDHVNGNGTEESTEPMDTAAVEVTRSEHFQTLLDAGLPQKVAEKLDEVYIAGTVCCDPPSPPSPREVLSPDSSWHRHIFNHSGLFDTCFSCGNQLFSSSGCYVVPFTVHACSRKLFQYLLV